MKVSDLLESRRDQWRELDSFCTRLERRTRGVGAAEMTRFAALYRATCGDLALADAYQLPPGTIEFLHQLVGRAHNQLYRSRTSTFRAWGRQLLFDVPQRLLADRALRLAFLVFWGVFLMSMYMAYRDPVYAERVVQKENLSHLEEMYSKPIEGRSASESFAMVGFYIKHNAGIGLQCFAFGLLFGIGGLYMTIFNAALLGAMFGHMARSPQWENFSHFVTAHGPFELTAVVLAAAAGMRLGFSLVDTGGLTRIASLRRARKDAMPVMGAFLVLFFLAALIEGLLSPSAAPYWLKAAVAGIATLMLLFYVLVLGLPKKDS